MYTAHLPHCDNIISRTMCESHRTIFGLDAELAQHSQFSVSHTNTLTRSLARSLCCCHCSRKLDNRKQKIKNKWRLSLLLSSGKRGKLITNICWYGVVRCGGARSLGKTTELTKSKLCAIFHSLRPLLLRSFSLSLIHKYTAHNRNVFWLSPHLCYLLKQVRGANREIDNREIAHQPNIVHA